MVRLWLAQYWRVCASPSPPTRGSSSRPQQRPERRSLVIPRPWRPDV